MKNPVYVAFDSQHTVHEHYYRRVSISELNSVDTSSISFWLIDETNSNAIRDIVAAIRRHPSASVYLKGIVLLTADGFEQNEPIRKIVDTCIEHNLFTTIVAEKISSDFTALNQWIDDTPAPTAFSDINISFKILRFIVSRNIELTPEMTTSVHCGYDYPAVSCMLQQDDIAILDMLTFLSEQRLLSPRFVTKTHLCNHCNSAFLNFKEVCSHCQSEEIKSEELIHHFKCAFTGQISEFDRDGKLICPKCDTALHHIGVDYDKPSILFNCQQCEFSFQEPSVVSTCFSCLRSSPPENQISETINAYTATSIGQNAAIYGLDSLYSNILRSNLNLFTQPAFKDFFDVEVARTERYKVTTSSLVIVQFTDLETLHIRLGRRAEEVFSELSKIFKSILRNSDVISARNESIFYMLLTETDTAGADLVVQRLTTQLTELFQNNLDYAPAITTVVHAIDKTIELDSLLENFLANDVH